MYLVSAVLPRGAYGPGYPSSGGPTAQALVQETCDLRPSRPCGIRDVRTTIGPSSRPILNPSSSIREMARPNYAGLRSGSRYLVVVAVSTDATRPLMTSRRDTEVKVDRIKVLIADDEEIVRESLASVIGSDPSLEVVGKAQDAQGAIDLAEWRLPDVALLDVRMPGGGPRAAREICRRCPPTRVVALSASEDQDSVLTMIRAGARSYVGKTATNDEILSAIHGAAEGHTQFSPKAVTGVFQAIADIARDDETATEGHDSGSASSRADPADHRSPGG